MRSSPGSLRSPTEMTGVLLSVAKRGAYPRCLRRRDRSDAGVVMSYLATTFSGLGTVSTRFVKKHPATRGGLWSVTSSIPIDTVPVAEHGAWV